MERLTQQTPEHWEPLRPTDWYIGTLDYTMEGFAAAFGWSWAGEEVAGLGLMFYLPLAWDGRSRFLLSVSDVHRDRGLDVIVSSEENLAAARADLIGDLGLTAEAWLAIGEDETVFARWDPPHDAGTRPPTARPRKP